MEDVVRKRVVGAVVLVVLGIVLPLLLARCMRDDAAGDTQSMRVYEITPTGEARPAGESRVAGADNQGIATNGGTDAPAQDATAQRPAQGDSPTGGPTAPEVQQAPAPAAEPEQQLPSPEPQPEPEPPAPEPEPQPSAPAASPESGEPAAAPVKRATVAAGWVVQVASFSDESNALTLARELNDNYSAFYTEAVVDGSNYYRVRIGPFDDEAAADAAAQALRDQGRNPLVLQVE